MNVCMSILDLFVCADKKKTRWNYSDFKNKTEIPFQDMNVNHLQSFSFSSLPKFWNVDACPQKIQHRCWVMPTSKIKQTVNHEDFYIGKKQSFFFWKINLNYTQDLYI